MAKQVKLTAERRTATGRSAVRKLKAAGVVPAVIYGSKDKAEPLQVSRRDINAMLSHASGENILVELEIAGKSRARAGPGSATRAPRRRNPAYRLSRGLDGRSDSSGRARSSRSESPTA